METEVREHLERIELDSLLSSGIFAKSPNLARMLSYICSKYWAGETDQIKEYNLAVEALGRPSNFDPSTNAIVRVEAHRLRDKLKKYYEKEGNRHEIVISLQPGNYVPRFVWTSNESDADVASAARPLSSEIVPEAGATAIVPLRGRESISQRDQDGQPSGLSQTVRRPQPSKRIAGGAMAIAVIVAACVIAIVSLTLILRHSRASTGLRPQGQHTVALAPKAVLPGSLVEARIRAGYSGGESASDHAGGWSSDRFFTGGHARDSASGLILRAAVPALFSTCRMGDFTYNIPLRPGDYQLWLYFVETFFGLGTPAGGGVTSRVFDVQANGRTLLNHFDIMSDAGGNFVADVRVFKDVHPAPDGYLHLVFVRESGEPMISAIRVEPGTPGKLLPIRIVAQQAPFTDTRGQKWASDRYFAGGRLTHYLPLDSVSQAGLYTGERYGNFNYAIPVAPGKYAVTLYFCEHYFGPDEPGSGGVGSRVFDVFSDGATLLKNFDIFKEAGGWGRPIARTFHDIEPNPQGKIDLQFEPVVNYPLVNAIQVTDESK